MNKAPNSLTVLGTIKLDVRLGVDGSDLTEVGDVYRRVRSRLSIGGTAHNVASAAVKTGRWIPTVIAAVGDDFLTPRIAAELRAIGAKSLLETIPGVQNAPVVVIEAGRSDNPADGKRVMLSASESPHLYLSSAHISSCLDAIGRCDVLIADTYSLQGESSSEALLAALKRAGRLGVLTVLDLLPHSLGEERAIDEVNDYIANADVVVTNLATLVGLVDPGRSIGLIASWREAEALAPAAQAVSSNATWLLRFGPSGIDYVLVVGPGRTEVRYSTLHRSISDRVGFGDRLLLDDLDYLVL